jgi:peptidoglycan/LPS O-acetylase OafA/YrhL
MILAFVMLFAGGMLLGGAWSFHRSGKPWWLRILLLLLGLVCVAICIWRIQT